MMGGRGHEQTEKQPGHDLYGAAVRRVAGNAEYCCPAVCQPDEDTPYGNAGILPRPVNEEVYPVCYFPGKGK